MATLVRTDSLTNNGLRLKLAEHNETMRKFLEMKKAKENKFGMGDINYKDINSEMYTYCEVGEPAPLVSDDRVADSHV